MDFSGGSEGKESACNAAGLESVPGLGRSPGEGNGNPFQYSCLGNPKDRGAWWATVHGVGKNWTQLSDSHNSSLRLEMDRRFNSPVASHCSWNKIETPAMTYGPHPRPFSPNVVSLLMLQPDLASKWHQPSSSLLGAFALVPSAQIACPTIPPLPPRQL